MFFTAIVYYAVVKQDTDLIETVSTSKAFFIYWGLANGPFAAVVVVLQNALILHDLENIASCFIHLTPPLVTWSMRWYVDDIRENWGNIFGIPSLDDSIAFSDVYVPAATFYIMWWVPYTLWMLAKGRFCHDKYTVQ